MRCKQKRTQPNLDGVEIKIDRAYVHTTELHDSFRRVFPRGTCETIVEVHDEGRRHVYRANSPPPPDPYWGAIAGDAIHNLRVALDHLAHQLVLLGGRQPSTSTAFPIERRRPRRLWGAPALPTIKPAVSKEIREILDSVQPYDRRHAYWLNFLRDLDNIDKHRVIVAVSMVSGAHGTTYDPDHPPPESETKWTRRPLVHNEVIGVIIYKTPLSQADPNLQFMPHVAFGDRQPLGGQHVIGSLHELRWRTEAIIDLFRPMFPPLTPQPDRIKRLPRPNAADASQPAAH